MQNKEIGEVKIHLVKVAEGDHTAFRQLFDFYKNRVYTYAVKYLKSEILAEEIVQEIFLKIWLNRGKLHHVDNFGGYLRTMSVNMTLDALRKIAGETRVTNHNTAEWDESDTSTEERIMRRDSDAYIAMLLQKLPKQQGLIYKLCHIEGRKHKEVAELLNISPLTVKSHLRDALKNLKTLIGENPAYLLALIFSGLLK